VALHQTHGRRASLSISSSSTVSSEENLPAATSTLSNFSFAYPSANTSLIQHLAQEGVACDGEVAVSFSEQGDPEIAEVYIATSPSTACMRFNPNAKVLSDYEKGYQTGDFEEVIHSQEKLTINGIPMLRQIYSQGYWTDHGSGTGVKAFDTSNEGSRDHELRYLFFDGSKFVTVAGLKTEEDYIDQIARSIRLKQGKGGGSLRPPDAQLDR